MLLYSESCSRVFSSTVVGRGRGWAQLLESYLLRVNPVQPWPCKMSLSFSQGSLQRGKAQ